MQRKLVRIAALAALATLPLFALADEKPVGKQVKGKESVTIPKRQGPKKRVAVAPMDIARRDNSGFQELIAVLKSTNNINTLSDVGLKMTSMLTTALNESGHFVVLERQDFGDIKGEMELTAEYGNQQTQVKKGNVLGAQMIIRAEVTEFTDNKNRKGGGLSLGPIQIGGAKKVAAVTIDLKFVDPNTSQVLHTAKAEGTSESSAAAVALNIGSLGLAGGESKEQPIEKATRDALGKAVLVVIDRMQSVPWEARVAKVEADGTLLLNRGANDGVAIGESFAVFAPGESVIDPETGESLGRGEDTWIGDCTVTWVSDRIAKARLSGAASQPVATNFVVKTRR